jgi:hypothetical protein
MEPDMNTKLISAMAATFAMGIYVGGAQAAAISCDTQDAMANAKYADQCAGDDNVGANPTNETTFVNNSLTGLGTADDFFFVDKTGDTGLAGFTLTVTESQDENGEFLFLYTLAVPTSYVGTMADWVLGVKQASDSFIAYLFKDVTLGIEGGFNSFYINPAGKTVNDYSHASGFLRTSGGGDDDVIPEPGVLFLMGAGLLGLGMARRRKSA